MAVDVAKDTTMSKVEFLVRLTELADELRWLGFVDEADRAQQIATEVRALPA
jgi:hypothetical protein